LLDIDPVARDQIRALPALAAVALAEAFAVLQLVPESGEPLSHYASVCEDGRYPVSCRKREEGPKLVPLR
jgi:hypothetical protein